MSGGISQDVLTLCAIGFPAQVIVLEGFIKSTRSGIEEGSLKCCQSFVQLVQIIKRCGRFEKQLLVSQTDEIETLKLRSLR